MESFRASPLRDPVYLLVLSEHSLLELCNFDEPLLSSSQQQRSFAPPTMRIGMLDRSLFPEQMLPSQILQNNRVGLTNRHTRILPSLSSEPSRLINWREYWQSIALANFEIFLTVSRSSMHDPSPFQHRNMLRTNKDAVQFPACIGPRLFQERGTVC